jgi:hypothetical protein
MGPEFEGHSTNLMKLKMKAAFSWYSRGAARKGLAKQQAAQEGQADTLRSAGQNVHCQAPPILYFMRSCGPSRF